MYLKFIEKVRTIVVTQVELKSPFFRRGNLFCGILAPLWKRGEGGISDRMMRELYSELWFHDTSYHQIPRLRFGCHEACEAMVS